MGLECILGNNIGENRNFPLLILGFLFLIFVRFSYTRAISRTIMMLSFSFKFLTFTKAESKTMLVFLIDILQITMCKSSYQVFECLPIPNQNDNEIIDMYKLKLNPLI